MAKYVFKKKNAGIRKLLQSDECMNVIKDYAKNKGECTPRPFVGFDRAKVFIKVKTHD